MGTSFTEFGLIKWSGIRLRTAVALLTQKKRDSLTDCVSANFENTCELKEKLNLITLREEKKN